MLKIGPIGYSTIWLLVILAGLAFTNPVRAQEKPIKSLYDEVFALPLGPEAEAGRLEASHRQAERHGNDLIIWHGFGEPGLIFRDFSLSAENGMTDSAHFTYFGSTDVYDLVVKYEDHDAPTLYLTDKFGRVIAFPVSLSVPYASPTSRHLLDTGNSLDLTILGMTPAHGYQDELHCKANKDAPMSRGLPGVLSFSDDLILLEWRLYDAPVGTVKFVRDGRNWTTEQANWFTCK